MNCLASDNNDIIQQYFYRGTNTTDSVFISYDDLKLVNSKLIELEYEKKINKNLREVVRNDSCIIANHVALQQKANKNIQKITRQRNIFIGTTVGVTIVGLVTALLLVK